MGPLAVVLVGCAGCLASTYRIPPEETARLATLPPEQRGQRIRVVQDVMGFGPSMSVQMREDVVHLQLELVSAFFRASSPGSASPDSMEAAAVTVIVAAVATLGLLAAEGVRYDGWVALDPETPVLLESRNGVSAGRLGELQPDDLLAARDAYVNRDSGFSFRRLERAPLSRRGGTYALHGGIATDGDTERAGGTIRPELGIFVTERVGLKLAYEATFGRQFRHALMLHGQWMLAPPLGAWLHAGRVGIADGEGPIAGGGLILEIPAATRLSFEARAGLSWVEAGGWQEAVTSVTLGVAIY